MRLLTSWVRDFVDVTASPAEIAEALALRGFEVASIEPVNVPGASGSTGPTGPDAVIDFEVTANRPDCLSVLGFAREIATNYDLPLRLPSEADGAPVPLAHAPIGSSDRVAVTIEDAVLCPRYAAAVCDVVQASSPAWMTGRLQAAGVRPISPLVDITNYVLLELGHPLHAFDLDTLAGGALRIRRATAGERLTTLDGVARTLDAEMLVIADRDRAQAVAGVMGGSASEISPTTRTVVFESAYFKPASVRRTSKRLGLKTEASSRFERGADINAPVVALQRALSIMMQIGAGRLVGPIVDGYPSPAATATIALRRTRLAAILGLSVPDADVTRILSALGMTVAPGPGGWTVQVPTFRVDLVREIDLIEEVGRHYGFDRIEAAFPPMTQTAPAPDPRLQQERRLRDVLTAAGLSEAITFGFVEASAARTFAPGPEADLVGVANPLSGLFDTLRPSLLPGLVDAVARNRRHGRRDVALFEIGARFTREGGEERAVGLAWTGTATPTHWSGTGREVDLFDVTGVLERVATTLGADLRLEPATVGFLVAGQAARLGLVPRGDATPAKGGKPAIDPAGVAGLLAPVVADGRGAPKADRIFVAELTLTRVPRFDHGQERVVLLPRHPHVVRDVSIVVPDALPAAIIRGTIQAVAGTTTLTAPAPLADITFFDRYAGKGIAEGSISLSIRLTFQAPDRTLTDAEVQQSVDTILAALVREHGATQR
jgi:phenylalanyl-tRNA synthetase beta chain